MEAACSFTFCFCLMLFFSCSSLPNTCLYSKRSETRRQERPVPRGADSPAGAGISSQHEHHTWLWFTTHCSQTVLTVCQPQLSQKHVVWFRGLMQSWKRKAVSGALSEGSQSANSKFPQSSCYNWCASRFYTEPALEQSRMTNVERKSQFKEKH